MGGTVELEDLARDATNGGSYCSYRLSQIIDDPEKDETWDGTKFFDLGWENEDLS